MLFIHQVLCLETSGARGLVKDFTPQVCAAFYVVSFVAVMQEHFPLMACSIGTDNRPSSYGMAQARAAALAIKALTVFFMEWYQPSFGLSVWRLTICLR